MSIESGMPSNHLILCCHLLLLPSIFLSIRVFSNESALHIRWPKYWSFSFDISPSNEHSELISFRMDWLDLLAVQGTLKSLLQHHSSKASILLVGYIPWGPKESDTTEQLHFHYCWNHLLLTLQKLAFEWVENLTNVILTQQSNTTPETRAREGSDTGLASC